MFLFVFFPTKGHLKLNFKNICISFISVRPGFQKWRKHEYKHDTPFSMALIMYGLTACFSVLVLILHLRKRFYFSSLRDNSILNGRRWFSPTVLAWLNRNSHRFINECAVLLSRLYSFETRFNVTKKLTSKLKSTKVQPKLFQKFCFTKRKVLQNNFFKGVEKFNCITTYLYFKSASHPSNCKHPDAVSS